MTLLAYHSDPAIKRKFLRRVEQHRKADDIRQGFGYYAFDNSRNRHSMCAVGCTIHGDKHADYESELGIPEVIAHLEDRIFESLPKVDARLWPTRFLKAIKPGADISLVWPKFALWLLTDAKHGVKQFTKDWPRCAEAIDNVAALWQRVMDGESEASLKDEFRAAADAADAAAYAATCAAACAEACAVADAAADATYAATCAAACAAAYAATCAEADAATCAEADAARKTFWKAAADRLIEQLSKATKP